MTILESRAPEGAVGQLSVGTFNIEHFGYKEDRGHPGLLPALDWLLQCTPVPPDILYLPEATAGLEHGRKAINLAVNHLSRHLEGGHYLALHSSQYLPGRRNHLYLQLVNLAKMRFDRWFDPFAPGPRSEAYDGFARLNIFGHDVKSVSEHWAGGGGREKFMSAAMRVSAHSAESKERPGTGGKVLMGGDYNSDSGWERERHVVEDVNWERRCENDRVLFKLLQKGRRDPVTGRWIVDTEAVDYLREKCDYLDAGEEVGHTDPTTRVEGGTSGLRIDRIFRSRWLPARVTKVSTFMPPEDLSDHGYVMANYDVEVAA